jgi:hypothetical protein
MEFVYELDRQKLILVLSERDGYFCMYPDCVLPFDPNGDSRYSVSIDHIYPQAKCRLDGWSYEEIWAIENLQLMHKICNAKKSDRTYDASGMLSRKGPVRVIKAARPDWCDLCDSGRLLYPGEFCPDCESGAQPSAFPAVFQKSPKDCSHGWTDPTDHCWMCVIGHVDRCPATVTAFGHP